MGGCEETDPIKKVVNYSKKKKYSIAIFRKKYSKIWKNFELSDAFKMIL